MSDRLHIGIGGWTYAPWRGLFYPAKLPQAKELHYASRALTSIEINGTYYSTFKPASWARWRDETPPGFVFAVKGSRFCTNRKDLGGAGEAVARFVNQGLAELGDQLGPISWQFAPTKKFDPAEFKSFLDLLPRDVAGLELRHAIEPRHPSFMSQRLYDLARRHNVAIVLADHDTYPRIDEPTADFTYARLMRSRAEVETGYPAAELDRWAEAARGWTTRGDAFVYVISGAKERAPAAAAALIARTSERCAASESAAEPPRTASGASS
jgi:uncharacterized protein YecE (DUF72 family)